MKVDANPNLNLNSFQTISIEDCSEKYGKLFLLAWKGNSIKVEENFSKKTKSSAEVFNKLRSYFISLLRIDFAFGKE